MVYILLIQMINIVEVYKFYDKEYKNRLEMIYSAIANGEKEITIPSILTEDSRIIETREGLYDLSERLSSYYGFESVTITTKQ